MDNAANFILRKDIQNGVNRASNVARAVSRDDHCAEASLRTQGRDEGSGNSPECGKAENGRYCMTKNKSRVSGIWEDRECRIEHLRQRKSKEFLSEHTNRKGGQYSVDRPPH